jgi:DNA polymerase III gamma/tau subunit
MLSSAALMLSENIEEPPKHHFILATTEKAKSFQQYYRVVRF